jgi:hypothetical protein
MKVVLHGGGNEKHYVEFIRVPLTQEDDCRCLSAGALSAETARAISRELAAGRVYGRIHGYNWYRQAGRC